MDCSSGYGFHFQHRNPRAVAIESFEHDSGAPSYVPNTDIPRDLQTPTVQEEIRRYSSPQRTPERPNSEPHGATRQQATAKTSAKRSAYRIPVFVVLVCQSHSSPKATRGLEPISCRGALLSTLLQFAECSGTDCK
jgi:hypothetical protein